MSIPQSRLHTDAVIKTLTDAGLKVGDSIAPADPPPYSVVYPLAGLLDGPLNDPHADGQLVYQVTSVGKTRQQAEWARDKVREALLAGFVVAGRSIALVRVEDGGVERDDDVRPPVFFVPDRFRIWSTPG